MGIRVGTGRKINVKISIQLKKYICHYTCYVYFLGFKFGIDNNITYFLHTPAYSFVFTS